MRLSHFIAGLLMFGLGLFLAFYYSPLVVEFIKGAVQPVAIVIGLLALLSVVFDRTPFKKTNLMIAVIFLAVGLYGMFAGGDEYIATCDLFVGLFPIAMVICGLLSVLHGIRKSQA
jgi:asparagine N-glycosylation enzyme membrane subunit Stt3